MIYRRYVKRVLDFILSLLALIVLSPVLLLLTVTGTFVMKGNPFFFQERPGKDEKIFKLIKFRSMDNRRDQNGELLPDYIRLNKYGRFLRATSLDELPELINILKGDMSIVGPRPLAVSYLPYYNETEKRRHTVLPGLTGLAQINGRNAVNWPERFAFDIQYVDNISFRMDITIILKTILKVLKKSDIAVRGTTCIKDFSTYRKEQLEKMKEKND